MHKTGVPIKFLLLFLILNGCGFNQREQTHHSEIHFSLDEIGLKAPVEFIFYQEKYHLFYQYVKDNQENWGHVASDDLINWQTITPESRSASLTGLGSGSIIVDWNNTLGTGSGSLLAFYTGKKRQNKNGQAISIIYSNDGITWKSGENYKILLESTPEIINDIKVFWHENTQRWIMLVLSSSDLRVYSSVDLINWSYENMFEAYTSLVKGMGKYIEFFPVDVEGSYERKWVLLVSVDAGSPNQSGGIQYFIGDFDGYSFKYQGRQLDWLDHGSDNYAGVCLSNYQEYGKPLYYMGLIYSSKYENLNEDILGKDYYTIPRKISVIKKHRSYYLLSNPADELESRKKIIKETSLSGKLGLKSAITSPQEINMSFDVNNKLSFEFPESFGIQLSNDDEKEKLTIGYHSKGHYFFISEQVEDKGIDNFSFSQYIIEQPLMDIKIIVDYPVVEMFAMDGAIVLTQKLHTPATWKKKTLYAEGGKIELEKGSLIRLHKN